MIAEKQIEDTINNRQLIPKDGHVIIGLSGGPDSLCLFHVLYTLSKKLGIQISTVHLNHKFRPGFAEEDQKFVEDLCKEYSVPCYSKTVDVNEAAAQRGETPEEAGRNERYRAFDEEAIRIEKSGIKKEKIVIAVAQNSDDRIETVIMRIMRGTGPDGLEGIAYSRRSQGGFMIVRPLLDTDRLSIEEYCEAKGLNPRRDHTNKETNYRRNKIRLDLLPKLQSDYNHNIKDAIMRLSRQSASDKKYFENITNAFISENCEIKLDKDEKVDVIRINTEAIKLLHPSVSRRIIISVLKKMGLAQDMEAVHIKAAINAINKEKTGKTVEFPLGYKMKISYGYAEFYNEYGTIIPKKTPNLEFSLTLDDFIDEREYLLPGGRLLLKNSVPPSGLNHKNTFVLNKDRLKKAEDRLMIRYRIKGDRITLPHNKGRKKIQDLFVDEKIPREKRDDIPLLTIDNEILWVIGVRRSGEYNAVGIENDSLLLEWKPNT